jgi:hypothetical protein
MSTKTPKQTSPSDPALAPLGKLVGRWSTESTHPAMPGQVVRGEVNAEWFKGGRFLIQKAHSDNPAIPDAICLIGYMGHGREDKATHAAPLAKPNDQMSMHYYDSRGVFRKLDVTIDDAGWKWSRFDPGFSQRFTGKFADGGNTIVGQSQVSKDDIHWEDDLAITYRRAR